MQECRETLQSLSVDPPRQRTHILRIGMTYTHLHDAKDAYCERKPHQENEYQHSLAKQALEPQHAPEGHVPKHLR